MYNDYCTYVKFCKNYNLVSHMRSVSSNVKSSEILLIINMFCSIFYKILCIYTNNSENRTPGDRLPTESGKDVSKTGNF